MNHQNDQNQKLSLIVVIFSWVITAITCLILGLCKYEWTYYLIGALTGLMTFSMMVKFSRSIANVPKDDPILAASLAKKASVKSYLFRLILFVGVFVAIFFKEVYGGVGNEINLLLAFAGYASIKVIMILVYLIFRKKVDN